MAIEAGADALGFNFFPGSQRFISLEENRSWIASLIGQAFRVAVVVNASLEELTALRESGCFEAVQFHGTETPELCATIGFPVWIRAVRVQGEHSLTQALQFKTPHLLLDAWSAGPARRHRAPRRLDFGCALCRRTTLSTANLGRRAESRKRGRRYSCGASSCRRRGQRRREQPRTQRSSPDQRFCPSRPREPQRN